MRQAGRTSGASSFKNLRGRLEKANPRYGRAGAIAVRGRAWIAENFGFDGNSQNDRHHRRP